MEDLSGTGTEVAEAEDERYPGDGNR
jgi:hypothetical protein